MKSRFLAIGLLALVLAACGGDETGSDNNNNNAEENNSIPLEQRPAYVTFDATGGNAGTTTPKLVDSYWVYDAMTAHTRIDIRGENSDWDDIQVKINLPITELGSVSEMFTDDSEVADDLVIVFKKGDTDYVLVPRVWTAEVTEYDDATDTITGTFSGEFWEWDKEFYSEIVAVPTADRTLVDVTNGRFKVAWVDRLGGQGQKWP